MANEQNLRPARTREEASERGRNGARVANRTKRRKADIRKAMHELLTSPGPTLEGEAITYEQALVLAMVNEALGGGKNNVAAYNAIMSTLKLDREEAERKARVAKLKAEVEDIKRRMNSATGSAEAPVVIIDDIPDDGDGDGAGTTTAVFDALGESERDASSEENENAGAGTG